MDSPWDRRALLITSDLPILSISFVYFEKTFENLVVKIVHAPIGMAMPKAAKNSK